MKEQSNKAEEPDLENVLRKALQIVVKNKETLKLPLKECRCPNDNALLGKIQAGAKAELYCRKCKQLYTFGEQT